MFCLYKEGVVIPCLGLYTTHILTSPDKGLWDILILTMIFPQLCHTVDTWSQWQEWDREQCLIPQSSENVVHTTILIIKINSYTLTFMVFQIQNIIDIKLCWSAGQLSRLCPWHHSRIRPKLIKYAVLLVFYWIWYITPFVAEDILCINNSFFKQKEFNGIVYFT